MLSFGWKRVLVLLLVLASSQLCAQIYQGSLTSTDGGLLGTGAWVDQSVLPAEEQPLWTAPVLNWTVSRNTDWTWHYSYSLTVYRQDVSHFIVETSDNFTDEDIMNILGGGAVEIGAQKLGPSNPNMPEAVYGIKFGAVGTSLTVSFDSPRCPIWGDFYAKDGESAGGWNTLWNAGFTSPDTDPDITLYPAGDGSVNNHVLVPDTEVLPEPTSLLALCTGVVGLIGVSTRRRHR